MSAASLDSIELSQAERACAILSVEEMYQADEAAVTAGHPGRELMAAAGASVARVASELWTPRHTLVLCGPGNNGGDGFVVARHLAAAGWPVRLALLGERERLKGDAAYHAAEWDWEPEPLSPGLLSGVELVIDALFGAGLSRGLEGMIGKLCDGVAAADIPLLAIDVPSGLCGNTGTVVGERCFQAAATVTFFRKKPGHLLLPGRQLCGDLRVVDIGIPEKVLSEIGPATFENRPALWREALPRRGLGDHKYRYGHALVAGGSHMTGAGRLAARSALRIGAGLVTLAAPREAWPIYAGDSPSVIALPLDREEDFAALLHEPRRNVVLLGPGNGVSEETKNRVVTALGTGKDLVLDADALSVFQGAPEPLFEAIATAPDRAVVLTPHEGEFARLFPDLTGDKLGRARLAAARSGAVVLLKGADSVIAEPGGRAVINANAPPELATAGTGDVLAGMITGLLAQGLDPFMAAAAATWLHGAAGARRGLGLIAEDLAEELPKTLDELFKN